ncbi:unnamed protein product [Microthlaspi erraticum]|uniref:SHSP domain-containing protein n=1 Tax=Microthlaspi erraticum TaxID=1685480 RepID=A0A6D2I798_9BRAS|nr:unnamed protein product [Microthlaspi erraticum]
MGERCVDFSKIPLSEDGFYATNNQFQRTGPKGFIEVKVLENEDLYVRVDFPGLPSQDLKLSLANERKLVQFSGKGLSDFDDDKEDVREFYGETGLGCDCCKINDVTAKAESGVIRMTITRVKVKERNTKCILTLPPFIGKSGRHVEDNPFVVKGRKGTLVGEPTDEGGLNFAVDVPGVCADDIEVIAQGNEVRFFADTKDDDEGVGVRSYEGTIICPNDASSLADSVGWDVEFGVLKILIPPPTKKTTTTTTN